MMMCLLVLALLAAASADPLTGKRVARSSGCDKKYSDISSSHTMCLQDVGEESPLSDSNITDILNKHNTFRNDVSPTATNLFKLTWDADMAEVALKWAKQCTLGHDRHIDRRVPSLPGVHIGQNSAGGHVDILAAVASWHSEVNDFEYGVGNTSTRSVGHYTQVVGFRAVRVGCGQASCTSARFPRYQVCNYASAQQFDEMKKPYKQGASCSDCPAGKCEEKLCNCDGKVCLNGGTLDAKTCKCFCKTTHTGINCQTEAEASSSDCPIHDQRYCNTDKAALYGCGDWMKKNCPIKCEVCPAPEGCTTKCKNGGILTPSCTCNCLPDYTGDTCETLACSSNPPSPMCVKYGASDCAKMFGLQEICTSLCGLCP